MPFKDNLLSVGQVIAVTGMSSCFIMAVVGTIAIDVVLLLIVIKASTNHPGFMTGFLCGGILGSLSSSRTRNNINLEFAGLFLSSMICTVIACVLASVFLGPAGIPIIIGLVGGWVAAFAMTLLGVGICNFAESLTGNPASLRT